MKINFNHFLLFIVVIFTILFSIFFIGETKTEIVTDCKVLKLYIIKPPIDSKDEIEMDVRYVVVTNKETFVCTTSIINGKFYDYGVFFKLHENEIYTFKVCGFGKCFMSDYRNILEIVN